jgi:ABC-type proline/glycine betaine transport system substrate-binding protein
MSRPESELMKATPVETVTDDGRPITVTVYTPHRLMICLRADGSEITRRAVPLMKRYTMQASADHKAADEAKADLGAALDRVKVGTMTLHFDAKGKSYWRRSAR